MDINRLRTGERILAVAAIALFIDMFFLKWYGIKGLSGNVQSLLNAAGVSTSVNAWHGLSILRWLMLITIALALYTAFVTAADRRPALPVAASVITTAVGLLLAVLVLYRTIINQPGPNDLVSVKFGAYLGLVICLALAYGGWRAMQDEGTTFGDARDQLDSAIGDMGRGESRAAPPPAAPPPAAPPAPAAPASPQSPPPAAPGSSEPPPSGTV